MKSLAMVLVVLIPLPCFGGIEEASVIVRVSCGGHTNVGSGTLVAKDKDCYYGVTSGHAFEFDRRKIGKLFDIETKDYIGTAKLLDLSDKADDIAIFFCSKMPGLDIVPIADKDFDDKCPVVLTGFVDGKYIERQGSTDQKKDWFADKNKTIPICRFQANGSIVSGMSGGGIIQGGMLFSVLSAGDPCAAGMSLPTVAYTPSARRFQQFAFRERSNCFGGVCRRITIRERSRGRGGLGLGGQVVLGGYVDSVTAPPAFSSSAPVPPPVDELGKDVYSSPKPRLVPKAATETAVTQADLDALEQRLLTEMRKAVREALAPSPVPNLGKE